MAVAYAFMKEQELAYSGSEQTITPWTGATHYESEIFSGGGAGGAVPVATGPGSGAYGAAAAGGGAPGISRNRLRSIVTPLKIYVARGGQPQTLNPAAFDGTYNGLPGQDSYIKENGVIVLKAQGAQGGGGCDVSPLYGERPNDSAGLVHVAGGCSPSGGGGNHDYSTGDKTITGPSGFPGLYIGNVRIMGGGGNQPLLSAGGKSHVSVGPGHGPSGGALAYGGYGPFQGAAGIDGVGTIRWYVQITV